MQRWGGKCWHVTDGSPEIHVDKDTGDEAPPEFYAWLSRKSRWRAGFKPSGRPRKAPGQTEGEIRLAFSESTGESAERMAARDGIDPESVKRSQRRARRRVKPLPGQ
jgi:hypothetical protein